MSECEAKLSDVRVFYYNEYPKANTAMFGHGMILLNHITTTTNEQHHDHEQQHYSDPFFFALFALTMGDFDTIAEQVLSCSSTVFSPKTRESLAQEITDHVTSCFRFTRSQPMLVLHLPMLVIVLDIHILDPQAVEYNQEPKIIDHHSFYLKPCKRGPWNCDKYYTYIDSPEFFYKNHFITRDLYEMVRVQDLDQGNVDELYQVLRTVRSSPLYSDQAEYDGVLEAATSHEEKHKEVARAIQDKIFFKIKPTLKLMQPQDLGPDCECAICFDSLSSDDDEHGTEMITKFVGCNHVFHKSCIFKWLSRKQSCPYCRSSCVTPLPS